MNINGVWNLVLSCKSCNRGENGKFAKLPKSQPYLEKLYNRNDVFMIDCDYFAFNFQVHKSPFRHILKFGILWQLINRF